MASLQIFYAPNDHRIQMTRIITLPERQHIVHHLRLWFDPFAKSHRGDFGAAPPPKPFAICLPPVTWPIWRTTDVTWRQDPANGQLRELSGACISFFFLCRPLSAVSFLLLRCRKSCSVLVVVVVLVMLLGPVSIRCQKVLYLPSHVDTRPSGIDSVFVFQASTTSPLPTTHSTRYLTLSPRMAAVLFKVSYANELQWRAVSASCSSNLPESHIFVA